MKGNVIVGQSGGPTAVINSSLAGVIKASRNAGIEKIFFGSDNPIDGKDTYFCNREGFRSLYQQYFYELKDLISPQDYNKLMYENAASVFDIKL